MITIRVDSIRETIATIVCTASYSVTVDSNKYAGYGDVELCRLTGECILQSQPDSWILPGNTDTKERIRTYIISACRAGMALAAARLKQTPIYFHYAIDSSAWSD